MLLLPVLAVDLGDIEFQLKKNVFEKTALVLEFTADIHQVEIDNPHVIESAHRFGDLLRQSVAQTVASPQDLEAERLHLRTVLSGPGGGF